MGATKFPYGRQVKLLAYYQGYPDGRLVLFEIWRQKGGKKEKLDEVNGVTKGGKAIGWWTPRAKRQEAMPLEKEIKEKSEEAEYYFMAKIDEKEVKSENFVFTYLLDVSLKDFLNRTVDGAKYVVTFSDGSSRRGAFKDGHATFSEVPAGKFKIGLEEYEFDF